MSALFLVVALWAAPAQAAPKLEVSYQPLGAIPGKVVLVDIGVAADVSPIARLDGGFGKFTGVSFPITADRRRHRALLPLSTDSAGSTQKLTITATLDDGRQLRFDDKVVVQPDPYDRRDIKVGKQFTQPTLKQRRRAAKESQELDKVLAVRTPVRLWRGSFARPAQGVETSPYGTLRTYNKKKRRRHLGLDLDGKIGDPIVATNRGRVAMASERFYSGGTVVLDHGQGLFTMYFHMSQIDVKLGQIVEKGEGLGAVGKSGQVTGPHLHFTVRVGSTSVDPAQLLALDLSLDAELEGEAMTALPR